jgi:hypothetical protein
LEHAETTEDRELTKALFLTPLVGMPYREMHPALATAAATRNCGKSTLAEAVGVLYGGYIDIRLTDKDTERMFRRLPQPSNVHKRACRLDNVKELCGSGEPEHLLATPRLTGTGSRLAMVRDPVD